MSISPFAPGSPAQVLFDAMPAMVFVVDRDVSVVGANQAAARALGPEAPLMLRRLCGEALRCINSGAGAHLPEGCAGPCGESEGCEECVVRQSAERAVEGQASAGRQHSMRLLVGGERRERHFRVSASPLLHEGRELAVLVLDDVTELTHLRRLVPMCAWCRRVEEEGRYQETLESYVRKHTLMEVSHGICPDCLSRVAEEQGGGGAAPAAAG